MAAAASPSTFALFVGVDIAAASATAAWLLPQGRASKAITIPQTADGYATLQQRLLTTGVPAAATLVVLEATGTYWVSLATTLHQQGFAISVINPAQAHAFAKALLKRAKTDAIDAQTLAELGARLQPDLWTPPPAIYAELYQRLAQRDALVDMRTQLRNQLHALVQQPVVIASVRTRTEALIATLTAEIGAIEAELLATLQLDDAWAQAAARLQTITGVGLLTASWLLVTTLKFSLCPSPKAATSYAGLAPHPHQSGSSVRGRGSVGHDGNARLRRALYLASLSATRHNPVIRAFYTRLREAGKPPKVARCAAARKLLHIAWAVVTKQCDFDPDYAAVRSVG